MIAVPVAAVGGKESIGSGRPPGLARKSDWRRSFGVASLPYEDQFGLDESRRPCVHQVCSRFGRVEFPQLRGRDSNPNFLIQSRCAARTRQEAYDCRSHGVCDGLNSLVPRSEASCAAITWKMTLLPRPASGQS